MFSLARAVPVFAGVAATISVAVQADDSLPKSPPSDSRWVAAVKVGKFVPRISDFSTYYGDSHMFISGAELGYRVWRYFEVGAEGQYTHERGYGYLPLNGQIGGQVLYELAPVGLYWNVVFRTRLMPSVVPYVGVGVTRYYYQQHVEEADTASGYRKGRYEKAGLRFLIDRLDTGGAATLRSSYGIDHTFLVLEGQHSDVAVSDPDVNLGGRSWWLGLLFEF